MEENKVIHENVLIEGGFDHFSQLTKQRNSNEKH